MVRSRGRPTPGEWEAKKPEFEHLYLRMNWTLKAVRELFAGQGFDATLRQYKTKVNAWGFDLKKIKRPVWHSMLVVMKHRHNEGLSSAFLVPVRGTGMTVVRADKIQKETHRNRSVFDQSDFRRAQETLATHGVQVCRDDDQEIREIQIAAQQVIIDEPPQLEAQSHDHDMDSLEEHLSDDPAGQHSPSSADSIEVGLGLRSPFSDDPFHPAYEHPSVLTSATITAEQSSRSLSLWSNMDANSYNGPSEASGPSRASHQIHDADTISAMCSVFLDPSCNDQVHARPHNSSHALLYTDQDAQRAVRWVAPYFQSFAARRVNRPQLRDPSRDDAKVAFKEMLESSNRYIFLLCHWMTTVFASSNQIVLLTEFLADCCGVIEAHPNGHTVTYGLPLHFISALYEGNHDEIESLGAKFLESARLIKTIWGTESANYLVNQHYHAWLLLDRKQCSEAEQLLSECLPISERIMGTHHLVTINCLAIRSRCLAEMHREAEAVALLHDILHRLANCNRHLQAFRDRQLFRLAEHQMKIGSLQEAEGCLQEAINFRISHFGMNSATTWNVIEKFLENLRLQGRPEQASYWDQHYRDEFEREQRARS